MSQTDAPSGTVAVMFGSEAAHYSSFTTDLERLELPPGTVKDFEIGRDARKLRNELVQRALQRNSYWIWFITEDHTFSPDVVTTLLSREQPIVAPVVLGREAPFYPEAFAGTDRDGRLAPVALDSVLGPGTLLEILAAATSGLLVRRAVFESMPAPWFRHDAGVDEAQAFCARAREYGFEIFLDTAVRLGNRLTATTFPVYRGGRWELSVAVGDEVEMSVPLKHA